jgi:PAS domain S-box-containing protein
MNAAKILVVEDEQIVALDIKQMLQRSGYAVLGPAVTGEAAIRQTIKEQPDLVLMDIRLRGDMDGIIAAQEIRRRLDIPVIYLTAFFDEETLQRAKLTEPYGYLLKPFNENELNSTLQMSLHRHRLEQQLKEHEQWLAATLNSIGDGVITTDAEGRIKSMNLAAQEMTGWAEAKAKGQAWAEVVQLVSQESTDAVSGFQLLQTRVTLTDHWLLSTTGIQIPVDVTIRSIQDQQSRSRGTVVTLRDISARRQSQQAQAEKQELYRALFEKNHAVMLLIDPDTAQIIDANPAACSFYGYRKAELTAKKITELNTLPEAQIRAEMDRARAEKRTQFQIEHRLANGVLRQVEVHASPIKVDDRLLLCAIIHDVTERQHMEMELRQKEASYRALFEHAPAMYVITRDQNGISIITDCNQLFSSTLGYERNEVIGRPLSDFYTPDSQFELLNRGGYQRAMTGSLGAEEHQLVRRDGQVIDTILRAETEFDVAGAVFGTRAMYVDITDRKLAEAALWASENRYQTVVEDTPALICRFLPDGQLTFVNEHYCQYFDKQRAELEGYNFFEFIPLEQRAEVQAHYAALSPEQPVATYEHQVLTPDGTVRWQRWTDRALFDEVGRPVEYQSVGEDITDRKLAEDEIQRRNRELTLFNQVIAASVATTEPEKFLESACRELAQAFNLSYAVALAVDANQHTIKIVTGYAAQSVPPFPRRIFSFGPDSLIQTLLTTRQPLGVADVKNEPRLATWQVFLEPLKVASVLLLPLTVEAEVTGLLALAATEPRHFSDNQINLGRSVADQVAGALSRIQLQQQYRQLSTAIEQTAENVVITDEIGTILYVNPAFEQTSGYSRAEVLGQNPRLLKSGRQPIAFYRQLWQTINTGQVWQGRLINKKKDGSLYTEEATISPIRNEQGAIVNYVAVKRDVTRELKLEEQYHQAQKMEAIGLLAGGIAHDFNNILTGINGFAELLYQELPPHSSQQEDVAKILKGGQRAAELVRQLLAFSRKQIIEPKVVNLNSLVGDLERTLLRLIGEHIQLTTRLAPQLGSIKADPAQLEQIMLNLAINARDAMPNGGQLKFETANVTLMDEDVSGQLELQPGEFVRLTVSDTGIGMSAEVKAHLFEPFFTTKELGRGTGLGLATVYGIVKQNRGSIWVDSEPGQGATFQIYLPRVDESVTPQPQPEWMVALPQGSETILLVEDEPQVRELAAKMLSAHGYRVVVAANGLEALKAAEEIDDRFDLLITDVVMPWLSGPELVAKLKQKRPDLKVLYVSGYGDEMIAHHGVLEPDVVLLSKPFTAGLLAQKIRQLLESTK